MNRLNELIELKNYINYLIEMVLTEKDLSNSSTDEIVKKVIDRESDEKYIMRDPNRSFLPKLGSSIKNTITNHPDVIDASDELDNRVLSKKPISHYLTVYQRPSSLATKAGQNLRAGQLKRNDAEQKQELAKIPSAKIGKPYDYSKKSNEELTTNIVDKQGDKNYINNYSSGNKSDKNHEILKADNTINNSNNALYYKSVSQTDKDNLNKRQLEINKNKQDSELAKIPSAKINPPWPKFDLGSKDKINKSANIQSKDNSYKVPDLRTSPKDSNPNKEVVTQTLPTQNKTEEPKSTNSSNNPFTSYVNGVKGKFENLSKDVESKVKSKVDDVATSVVKGVTAPLNKAREEIKNSLKLPELTPEAKAKQESDKKSFEDGLKEIENNLKHADPEYRRQQNIKMAGAAAGVAALGVAGYAAYKMAKHKKWRDKGCSSLSNSVEKAKCKEYLKSKKG